jgi:uncharacterized repeat protein (TIGR03803 family)
MISEIIIYPSNSSIKYLPDAHESDFIIYFYRSNSQIMRIVYLLIITLFLNHNSGNSQGIYQLFGQTPYGGVENGGIIFTTNSSGGNFQTRYDYRIARNAGAEPWYSKLAEYNGKFYGMTLKGGTSNLGVIFEFDPTTNIYTKKIDFTGTNGSSPYGSLVLSGSKFYGMTSAGGTSARGVIFEWDPSTNAYSVKYNFNLNGDAPYGNVSIVGGLLYGITRFGGSGSRGVIFEWNPSTNTYTKKIDLTGNTGTNPGAYSQGSLTYSNGQFYGVTTRGGINDAGVIFQWDPVANIYIKKYDFVSTSNGNFPIGNMTENGGKFYGMTYDGGTGGGGVIYEWDPVANIYTRKLDLTPATGYKPSGELSLYNNKFYGLTLTNNTTGGSIIEWDPVTNTIEKKIGLNEVRGSAASGSLLISGNKMFGVTKAGGADQLGTIFDWDPASNVFTKRYDFGGKDDKFPTGTLTFANGKLYGACSKGGGINSIGLLFEWDPATSTYTRKFSFSGPNGRNPNSSLTYFNNKFYGMTTFGGAKDSGVIFEWDPAINLYTKKIDLSSETGTLPYGNLVEYNNKLYGMTSTGNAGNTGTIFEWDPATNVIIKKIDFTGPTGYHPFGSLALFNNKFYGTTIDGGPFPNLSGTLFEWDPATNIILKKIDFSPSNGYASYGTLTLVNNLFYGVTYFGGANSAGVLFEYNPVTNDYTKKYDFSVATGSNPQAGVTLSNGKLYGITANGGNNSRGVIFEFNPANNAYSKKYDFNNFSSTLYYNNYLLNVPSFIANGVANTCSTLPSITINNSNNNIWVPITDIKGDAVGEINANGNNLGTVTTSMYINSGPVREDAQNRLYLNRNVSITPQVQPTTHVNIRLYLKKSEFEALRTAQNSLGQPSGINSIADLQLFKNSDPCSSVVTNSWNPTPVTASQWGDNYVLNASITSFSSFYIAKNPSVVPVTLTRFSGTIVQKDALLTWTTAAEQDMAGYEVERSLNGTDFSRVGNRVVARNSTLSQQYQLKDQSIFNAQSGNVYYRLKMINLDGGATYSGMLVLSLKGNSITRLYPNPANEKIFLEVVLSGEKTQFYIYSAEGRLIRSEQRSVVTGKNLLEFNIADLPSGIYYLQYENFVKKTMFIKN